MLIRRRKGQATIEFLIMLPIFLCCIFFMVTVAVVWLGLDLTVQAAAEGAALEGVSGGGLWRAQQPTRFGARIGLSAYGTDVDPGYTVTGKVIRFVTNTTMNLPWSSPLLMPFTISGQGAAISPVWEFEPEPAP